MLTIGGGVCWTWLNLHQKQLNQNDAKPIYNQNTMIITPTQTLTNDQKASYIFYFETTNTETAKKILSIKKSDTGKLFKVNIGTLIILDLGNGKYQISYDSLQNIFEGAGSKTRPIHLPMNAKGAFRIKNAGTGKIIVIEKR